MSEREKTEWRACEYHPEPHLYGLCSFGKGHWESCCEKLCPIPAQKAKADLCERLKEALKEVVCRVKACAGGADEYDELTAAGLQGDSALAEYEKLKEATDGE